MTGNQTGTDGFRMGAKNYLNQILYWKRYFIADTPEGRSPGFKRHVFTLLESAP